MTTAPDPYVQASGYETSLHEGLTEMLAHLTDVESAVLHLVALGYPMHAPIMGMHQAAVDHLAERVKLLSKTFLLVPLDEGAA